MLLLHPINLEMLYFCFLLSQDMLSFDCFFGPLVLVSCLISTYLFFSLVTDFWFLTSVVGKDALIWLQSSYMEVRKGEKN